VTEEELAKKIAEEYDAKLRRAAVFSEGMQSPLWKELMALFDELERKAFLRWTDANAEDRAVIIELQQIGKLGRLLKREVQAAIDDAAILTQ
jgi:hypothetical protein